MTIQISVKQLQNYGCICNVATDAVCILVLIAKVDLKISIVKKNRKQDKSCSVQPMNF